VHPTASTHTSSAPTVAPANTGSGNVVINPAVCKGQAGGTGVSATEIDLGNVSTLTGPIPGLFIGAVHGIQAFATYVNSLGGICGRKLVVKSGDDNLQTSQNATATQSLASQVMAFVGSFSANDNGGAAVLKSTGTPDVGQALSSQRFDLPNNFSPEPITGWNTAPYVTMKQLYPDAAKHMAILGANQPVAQHEYAVEKAALESVGYHFVYTDPNIEPTQTDYSSDAQAMKSAGAQGVALSSTASLCANLAKAIQNAGITPFPLGTYSTTAYDQTFLNQAGSAAEGAILYFAEAMYQGEDAQVVPMVATFNRWYQGIYHQTPDEFALYSWMSGLLFIDGINRSSGLNQQALLAGLKSVTQFDANGLVATDDPAHKKPPTCYLIIDVKGGKFVRDPSDPPTGFNCKNAPSYYTAPSS
jgi:ABC-type branched-subunit amino acid transport system substrate-binding protein